MATATSTGAGTTEALDHGPRQSLGWGAGVLVIGLALVGVGADQVGSVVVLAGLLLTIYAIHTYGRLGPDEPDEGAQRPVAANAARSEAWRNVWRGGLVALAAVVTVAGSTSEGMTTMLFYLAIAAGAVLVARGARGLSTSRQAANKVEKRRRLKKSAPP
jgi:hypothetical protein